VKGDLLIPTCIHTSQLYYNEMAGCLWAGKLFYHATSHPRQLSLPSLRGRYMSTSYSWEDKWRYMAHSDWACS